MTDLIEKLVNNARVKLDKEKKGKLKIKRDEYRNFLKNLANKKCPTCGKKIELKKAEFKKQNNVESTSYEFVCGHKHHEINVSETIKIWESVKAKLRAPGKKPHLITLNKTEPGKNPKSIDGVSVSWIADRKNNKWKHIIKDIKTGKILHEEDMPLDRHK